MVRRRFVANRLPASRLLEIHTCSGGRSDCGRDLRRGGPRQPKIGCRSPPVAFGRATSRAYENFVRMTQLSNVGSCAI
jgi:hypothetical protein